MFRVTKLATERRLKTRLHLVNNLNLFMIKLYCSLGSDGKESGGMQEIEVRPLSGEDPLEKGMATHSSIVVWRIPRIEKPGGLQSMRS